MSPRISAFRLAHHPMQKKLSRALNFDRVNVISSVRLELFPYCNYFFPYCNDKPLNLLRGPAEHRSQNASTSANELARSDGKGSPTSNRTRTGTCRPRARGFRASGHDLNNDIMSTTQADMNVSGGKNGIKRLCSQSSLDKAIWDDPE